MFWKFFQIQTEEHPFLPEHEVRKFLILCNNTVINIKLENIIGSKLEKIVLIHL